MRDLGIFPGDLISAGLGINNRGDIVGASIDGSVTAGNPRAMLWSNGVMMDLNALVANSSMYLLSAFSINDGGEIAGFGVNGDGEVHGFLATPRDGSDNDKGHGNDRECRSSRGSARCAPPLHEGDADRKLRPARR
jgi:probable HAF family extracellular repeat protein